MTQDFMNQNSNSYKNIPIRECGEKLVSLTNLSTRIHIDSYYFRMGIQGTSPSCYLREEATNRLLQAVEKLPSGLFFVIFDAWRSYETQLALYEMTKNNFYKKGYSDQQVAVELSKFVAFPSRCLAAPSPHITGGAVDLTIANESGLLDMGTDFDEFSEKANANYYKKKTHLSRDETNIRDHRRLLTHVMTSAGFVANEDEWWHFDYGNQRWAAQTTQEAIYTRIEM